MRRILIIITRTIIIVIIIIIVIYTITFYLFSPNEYINDWAGNLSVLSMKKTCP